MYLARRVIPRYALRLNKSQFKLRCLVNSIHTRSSVKVFHNKTNFKPISQPCRFNSLKQKTQKEAKLEVKQHMVSTSQDLVNQGKYNSVVAILDSWFNIFTPTIKNTPIADNEEPEHVPLNTKLLFLYCKSLFETDPNNAEEAIYWLARVMDRVVETKDKELKLETYILLSEIMKSQEKWADFFPYCNAILKEYPNNKYALLGLLFVCPKIGEIEAGETAVKKLLSAHSKEDPTVTGDVAVFYSQIPGKEAEAEKHFETAIKQNPNNASIYTNYAQFMYQQKNASKAEELCNKATQVDKNYVPAYELYATILEEQQKLKEAAVQLRKSLEADPTDYKRWIRTGYDEFNSGQESNALEAFLEGLKRNEYDQELTLQIGKDFESKEMFDKASKIYEATILGAGPTKVAGVLGHYGHMLYQLRENYELVESLFQKAVKIDDSEYYPQNLRYYAEFVENEHRNKDLAEKYRKYADDIESQRKNEE